MSPQPQQTSTTGSPAQVLADYREQAEKVGKDLQQAGLHNASAAVARVREQFDVDTTQIAENFAFYLDPQTRVDVAVLKAAHMIAGQYREGIRLPFGQGYGLSLPSVPSVPSVSALYSPMSSSDTPSLQLQSSNVT